MLDFIKDNPFLFIVLFLACVAPTFLFGAMRVFGIIILVIIIIAMIFGIVIRYRIRRLQQQMGEQEQQRGGFQSFGNGGNFRGFGFGFDQQQRTQPKGEGTTKIYADEQATKKKVSDDVGDYVDFEEIKEK